MKGILFIVPIDRLLKQLWLDYTMKAKRPDRQAISQKQAGLKRHKPVRRANPWNIFYPSGAVRMNAAIFRESWRYIETIFKQVEVK
jgi:hypothetical protein